MERKYQDITLRDTRTDDYEANLRWLTSGEWRDYDAPWEGKLEALTEEQEENFKKNFIAPLLRPQPALPNRVTLALADDTPIGWVTRFGSERFPAVWYVGIDICEDAYLNKGLGFQALTAWTSHLFENSDIHKLEIHTWTINPRMMRLAEKLGYTFEGRERELVQWQGEWIDRVRYGLLRREWEGL